MHGSNLTKQAREGFASWANSWTRILDARSNWLDARTHNAMASMKEVQAAIAKEQKLNSSLQSLLQLRAIATEAASEAFAAEAARCAPRAYRYYT